MDAMQLVLESGEVFSGDRALPHILSRLHRWRWVAHIFFVPGVSLIAPVIYRLIARNRMAISTLITPKSERGNESCPADDVCESDSQRE